MHCKEVIVWMPFPYERPWGFEAGIKFHPDTLDGNCRGGLFDRNQPYIQYA